MVLANVIDQLLVVSLFVLSSTFSSLRNRAEISYRIRLVMSSEYYHSFVMPDTHIIQWIRNKYVQLFPELDERGSPYSQLFSNEYSS